MHLRVVDVKKLRTTTRIRDSRSRVVFLADVLRIIFYGHHTRSADVRNFFFCFFALKTSLALDQLVPKSSVAAIYTIYRDVGELKTYSPPRTFAWRPATSFPCAISHLAPCPLFIYFIYFYSITCLSSTQRSHNVNSSGEKRFVCKLNVSMFFQL